MLDEANLYQAARGFAGATDRSGIAWIALWLLISACCPEKPTRPPKVETCERRVIRAHKVRKCIRLKRVDVRWNRPSNVRVMFQALDCNGNPYPDLDVAQPRKTFVVEEDGRTVSVFESQQTILPRQIAARMYTLLLLDLSGSIRRSGNLPALQQRALEIVDGIVANQEVAVAAFDGRADIQMLQDFTSDANALRQAIRNLSNWREVDSSTNLYGAYIKGLERLARQQTLQPNKIVRGSLILITDGTDQASRVKSEKAVSFGRMFHRKMYPIYAIGVGGEIDCKVIRSLGFSRHYCYGDWSKFDRSAIASIVDRMDRWGRSFYLLSYCSPKRAGRHKVRISLRRHSRAVLDAAFDATGFVGGCDSRWVLKSCKFVQCGGSPGSACETCQNGLQCSYGRCVDPRLIARERQRKKAAALRAARERRAHQRRLDAQYRSCTTEQARRKQLWEKYKPLHEVYLQSDCGFRLMAEGGISLYPAPQGVAGSFLLGWSFRRWVEIHAGVGLLPATLLMQVRVKPWSWRWLDLMVVPRVGVGLQKKPWTFEAELLLGLRARIGRYFALYLQLGPGYAQSEWGPVKEKGFFLPGWLGVELRL